MSSSNLGVSGTGLLVIWLCRVQVEDAMGDVRSVVKDVQRSAERHAAATLLVGAGDDLRDRVADSQHVSTSQHDDSQHQQDDSLHERLQEAEEEVGMLRAHKMEASALRSRPPPHSKLNTTHCTINNKK